MRTSRALTKQIVAMYASVLYEASANAGSVDLVGTQLEDVLAAVRGHAELRGVMLDAELPAAARADVLRALFTDLDPALSSAIEVMLEQENFDLLSAISEEFAAVAEASRGTAVAEVTTVVPLTDELRTAIAGKLAADLGKEVTLREKVDPSILGGIIIDAAGRRIDASIVSQLESARVALSTTAPVGGDA